MYYSRPTNEQVQPTRVAGPREAFRAPELAAPAVSGSFTHDGTSTKYGISGQAATAGFDMRLETVFPGGATGVFVPSKEHILVVVEGSGRLVQLGTYSSLNKGDFAICSSEGFQLKATNNTLTVALVASEDVFQGTVYDASQEVQFTSRTSNTVRTRITPTVGGKTTEGLIDQQRQVDSILRQQSVRQIITPNDNLPVAQNFVGDNPQPLKFSEDE